MTNDPHQYKSPELDCSPESSPDTSACAYEELSHTEWNALARATSTRLAKSPRYATLIELSPPIATCADIQRITGMRQAPVLHYLRTHTVAPGQTTFEEPNKPIAVAELPRTASHPNTGDDYLNCLVAALSIRGWYLLADRKVLWDGGSLFINRAVKDTQTARSEQKFSVAAIW
jgi:hypothetical protein